MYIEQKKIYTIDLFDGFMKLIFIFPLTTLIQNYLDSINRVLFVALFVLEIWILTKRMKKKYLGLLVIALVEYIITLFNTENLNFSNAIVYYINWILYASLCMLNYDKICDWFRNNDKYVHKIIWIWTIAVGFSALLPSCYYVREGGDRYFGSFAGDIFRLGPTALFIAIMSVVSIVFYGRKKDILFTIIPLYCGLMGSSRTYFGCIVLVFLIALYIIINNKWKFYLSCIPIALVGVYFFANSALSKKVAYTLDDSQYGDFWFRITSSRSVIWARVLRSFNDLGIFGKLFGGGFGFSNAAALHYSHNDFIEILASHGYLGEFLYLFTIIILITFAFKGRKASKVLIILSVLTWLLNAFFNMFYYYFCAALSYPFLLFAVKTYCERNILNERSLK